MGKHVGERSKAALMEEHEAKAAVINEVFNMINTSTSPSTRTGVILRLVDEMARRTRDGYTQL